MVGLKVRSGGSDLTSMADTARQKHRSLRLADERGAILPLAAFMIILIFAVVALAVDITLKANDRQFLWNTTDAAALAGSSQLPDALAARDLAMQFALDNDPSLAGDIDITFRCFVADSDGDGQPDAADVPLVCDPTTSLGPGSVSAPPFVCADFSCASPCDPDVGDTCNTLVVETEKTTDFKFAPIIGIDEGDSRVISAACRGSCGGAVSGPVDLVLTIDRTTSMSSTDVINAKRASLAVLDFFNPALHWVSLGALGPVDPSDRCDGITGGSLWEVTTNLSSDYKNNPIPVIFDGETFNLDPTSDLVAKIICLEQQTGTNLGDPVATAVARLQASGRPGVKQGIILLSDGAATQPGTNPCQYAVDQANAAKAAGVELFTIGLGIGSKTCDDESAGSTWDGEPVPTLLAAMATSSTDNCVAGGENTDGDHFFCEPASADLQDVFLAAAASFAEGSKLVFLPPGA